MKTLTSKTVPYRRCEWVSRKLREWGLAEISRYDLRKLISTYCAVTPKMIDIYEKRFRDFGFLRNHSKKNKHLSGRPRKKFSPVDKQEKQMLSSNISIENRNQKIIDNIKSDNSCSNIELEPKSQQSKNVVYPVDGEKKVTLSFKGYKRLWRLFKKAVWADGFPDICYVEHIFHSAYLGANREKSGRIDIPVNIRNNSYYITMCTIHCSTS